MWILSLSVASAALPLPLLPGRGPTATASLERQGAETGQWATAGLQLGLGGDQLHAGLQLPAAAVTDGAGLRGGLGAPQLQLIARGHGDTPTAAGLQLVAPLGTPGVSERRAAATPWAALRLGSEHLSLWSQLGWTLATGGRPVALQGPDPAALAHTRPLASASGTACCVEAEQHLRADPRRAGELQARLLLGSDPGDRLVAGSLELLRSWRGTDLRAGIALAGPASRSIRPTLQLSAPLIAQATAGLHLGASLIAQAPSR